MKRFKRLLAYAKPYWRQYIGILILGIFSSSFQPGVALGVKPLVDGIFKGKEVSWMALFPIIIIVFTAFTAVARYIHMVWIDYLSEKIIIKIRTQLYNVYTSLSLDHYTKESSGRMITVLTSDIILLQEFFAKISSLFREPFTIVGLLAIAIYRDWKLTLILLILIPVVVYCVSKIGRRLRKMIRKRQEQWAILNSTMLESLSGIRIIKAFNLEKFLQRRFQGENNRLLSIQYKWIKIEKLSSPIMAILGGVGFAFFVYLGGVKGIGGGLNSADILSVGLAFGLILDPLKKLNALNLVYHKAIGASVRVFDAIDLKPSVVESPQAVSLKSFQNELVFDNVSFKYGDEWIVKDIHLRVKKGDVVAFVGRSGVGKTTLVNLIPRLYDVVKGSISLDGVDVRDVTRASLRYQISMVSQDVFLFNDTVKANISFGKQGASDNDVVASAKAANAHDFVTELPEGYDTVVGERGVRLSGGQRQRLSIARALLKNAPILILDEATSALDSESETMVQQAIDKLMQGRTCFIIAHRLSTIQHADRIVVMDEGRIVEEGTHTELMARKSHYYRYYQLQFSKGDRNDTRHEHTGFAL